MTANSNNDSNVTQAQWLASSKQHSNDNSDNDDNNNDNDVKEEGNVCHNAVMPTPGGFASSFLKPDHDKRQWLLPLRPIPEMWTTPVVRQCKSSQFAHLVFKI